MLLQILEIKTGDILLGTAGVEQDFTSLVINVKRGAVSRTSSKADA
jgi:hypothetical protein